MPFLTKKSTWISLIFISILLVACSSTTPAPTATPVQVQPTLKPIETELSTLPLPTEMNTASPTKTMLAETKATSTAMPTEVGNARVLANVVSVTANGNENAYTFAVEIRSPDTGCERYSNWWEVVSEDGELIYRRILGHSHVAEQPFTRSGGPVTIDSETVVIVRAHMHPTGYGGTAFRGSVNGGFEEIQLEVDFAIELENFDPLPDGCAF